MRLMSEDKQALARLARMASGAGVLSVYLEIDPATALHHGHVARLMDVLRGLRENIPPEEGRLVEAEVERVLSYVRAEYRPHGRTLALFSSRPRRLFRTLSLQIPITSLARFRPRPYVGPLWSALDDYPRTGVAVVDHERARLLSILLGEIEAERTIQDEVPRKQRQGGWAAFKFEQDRVSHIATHYRHVAKALRDQDSVLPFERLVIGGSDEATAALSQALPGSLRPRIAGTFRAELFAENEVLVRRAVEVAEKAEREEEVRLVQEICDKALGGRQAALGWPETLQTLALGRVHVLALDAGVQDSDQAEEARRLALTTGARTEIVHGRASQFLAPYEGIGAILRY